MALTTAVQFTFVCHGSGTPWTHELFEYPADLDALDDAVLEQLPAGSQYHLLVDGVPLQSQHLKDCTDRAVVLHVQVVLTTRPTTAAQKDAVAKVVLKLVDARPVQKHEMAEFPADVDELDDIVLNYLVTDGRSFTMTADGHALTQDRFLEYKGQGNKLLVHVHRSGQAAPAASLAGAGIGGVSAGITVQPGLVRESELAHGLNDFMDNLSGADRALHQGNRNVLVVMMKVEAQIFQTIKQDAKSLRTSAPEVADRAEKLILAMTDVFDRGVTDALASRDTIRLMSCVARTVAESFYRGDASEVMGGLHQLQAFANKLALTSERIDRQLSDLRTTLGGAYDEYQKKRAEYQNASIVSGAGFALCGSGGILSGGGAAFTGLWTAAVPEVAGVAGVSGWFGSSWGAVAAVAPQAAIPGVANPVGIAFLVGAGALLMVSAFCAYRARGHGRAEEAAKTMMNVVGEAQKVSGINVELWNGLAKHITVAKGNLENLAILGPQSRATFGETMSLAATSLHNLQRAIDEYLVYVDQSRLFPLNFSVESMIGRSQYEEIRVHLQIEDSAGNGASGEEASASAGGAGAFRTSEGQ